MYKVIYQLPFNSREEIYIEEDELKRWLTWEWLKDKIVAYEEINQVCA